MRHLNQAQIARLAQDGVILGGRTLFIEERWKDNYQLAQIALDAQPGLVTQANAGIPAQLTTLFDPDVVRVVTAPMRIAEVFGEVQKGSWLTDAIEFPIVESAGFVTSYGDWNNNGNNSVNISWTPRQPYFYQTVTEYGARDMERYGLAKLNLVSELDMSAALVMNQFQNASYAFGTANLQNYGSTNDPTLLPSILPYLKASTNYTWTGATAKEIFNDFLKLFGQLQIQMGGNIKMTDKIVVVLSPGKLVQLAAVTDFSVPAIQMIRVAFPNITFEQVPEYSTPGGELMQMFLPSFKGQQTAYTAFPEKMRLFPVIADLSGWKQKKAGGTWGFILKLPIALASMLGI